MRRIRHVTVAVHPSLYEKMELFRKDYYQKSGIKLSQVDITNIISKKWRPPKLDLIFGGKNAKKFKR